MPHDHHSERTCCSRLPYCVPYCVPYVYCVPYCVPYFVPYFVPYCVPYCAPYFAACQPYPSYLTSTPITLTPTSTPEWKKSNGGSSLLSAADLVVAKPAIAQSKTLLCDASAPPANGTIGDCTAALAAGSTCQPACDTFYTASGATICSQAETRFGPNPSYFRCFALPLSSEWHLYPHLYTTPPMYALPGLYLPSGIYKHG